MIGAILIILGVLFGLGIWFISAAGITACMLSSKISQYEERLSLSTKDRPRLLLPDALAAQAGMPWQTGLSMPMQTLSAGMPAVYLRSGRKNTQESLSALNNGGRLLKRWGEDEDIRN